MNDLERFQTLHPDPEKGGPRILRWKYQVVRDAILRAVPDGEPGLPFRDLSAYVRGSLEPQSLEGLGSVMWYVTTVKLDLEARGEIARVPGARPQRLIRLVGYR